MNNYGVIFDMDGVLVDSFDAHFVSWQRLAEAHGLTITEAEFAAEFGRTTREIIRDLWADHIADCDVDACDRLKEQFYREILREHFPEMPGEAQLLTALSKAGFALAIGSSGPAENVAVCIECMSRGDLISTSVNAHDVTHGKPHPEVFLKAAEKLSLPAEKCLVVEDAPAGITAARSAGMAVIAITGTAEPDALSAADLIVESLTEITPEIVRELIEKN